jgi:hypothetical protein
MVGEDLTHSSAKSFESDELPEKEEEKDYILQVII